MANNNNINFLIMAMLVMAQILSDKKVLAQCDGKVPLPLLISECAKFVKKDGPKVPPSAGCCEVVTKVDIPCVCKLVTSEIEKIISMEKVIYVARTCGIEVKPGFKCGSYTVPPLA